MATYAEILDAEVSAEAPITVSLMTRLRDNALAYLGAPSGTKLIFPQAAAPLGWTKDTTHNDKALRIVSGAGGGIGGTRAFSTVFGLQATEPDTPNVGKMALHTHTGITALGGVDHTHGFVAAMHGGTGGPGSAGTFAANANLTTGGASAILHQHVILPEGSSDPHSHGIDIRVQYVDSHISIKD